MASRMSVKENTAKKPKSRFFQSCPFIEKILVFAFNIFLLPLALLLRVVATE